MSDGLGDAIVAMLREAAPGAIHWTVLLDRALKAGAVDPAPEARNEVLRALAALTRDGRIEKTSAGTYAASGD